MKTKHWVILGAAVLLIAAAIVTLMHAQGDEAAGRKTMKGPVAVVVPNRPATEPAQVTPYRATTRRMVLGPATGPSSYETLPPRRAALGAAVMASKDGRALVNVVLHGSPAESVGLQAGDEITGVNDARD